jgi:hypothetical protein
MLCLDTSGLSLHDNEFSKKIWSIRKKGLTLQRKETKGDIEDSDLREQSGFFSFFADKKYLR